MRESGPAYASKHIEFLTQQYAFYLRFQNGYGDILLGIIYGLVYLVNWLFGPGALSAGLTVALPIVWIVSKDLILSKCYSTFGKASDHASKLFRYWRVTSITLATLLAGYWLALRISDGWLFQPTAWISLLIMSVLPVIVWRYLRTPLEYISGVLLMLVGVISSSGKTGDFFAQGSHSFPVFGLYLIIWGILEHLDFCWLAHCFKEV